MNNRKKTQLLLCEAGLAAAAAVVIAAVVMLIKGDSLGTINQNPEQESEIKTIEIMPPQADSDNKDKKAEADKSEADIKANDIKEAEEAEAVAAKSNDDKTGANEQEEEIKEEVKEKGATAEADNSERIAKRTGDEQFYYTEITDDIKARITGISYPGTADMQISYDDIRYLRVHYNDYSGNTQTGELICNKAIADDLLDIFKQLYLSGYQICKIKLIDEYGGDDDASCADDNTSCFNYRPVTGGKKLSRHAYGMAIDINPYYNPYVKIKNGQPSVLLPATAAFIDRSQSFPHKIDEQDLCYQLFKQHGFTWGGSWNTVKDYQHFER